MQKVTLYAQVLNSSTYIPDSKYVQEGSDIYIYNESKYPIVLSLEL